LAAELDQEFGITTRLIRGGGGIFDIVADGELVFSKFRAGRFPNPGEIEGLIRRIVGPKR
jgi:predicted Rdx family selenoprotein